MKVQYLFYTILLSLIMAEFPLHAQEKLDIRQGVVDLRSFDLKEQKLFSAEGQVAFYWRKTLAEAQSQNPDALLEVPGSWNQKSEYSAAGYGVYHLTVLTRPDVQVIALKIPRLNFAHRVWSSGQLLSETGHMNSIPTLNQAGFSAPTIYSLPVRDGRADLWLEAAEYWQHFPGIKGRLILGDPVAVAVQEQRDWFVCLLPQGGLLLIGLYMVGVGWLYRRDRSLMSFGISSLIQFVYLLAADEARGVRMLGISDHTLYYAIYNVWFFAPYFMLIYFNGQFPHQKHTRLERIWGAIAVSFYTLQFTMSLKYFFYLINVFQLLLALFLGHFFVLAWQAYRTKRPGGKSLFLAVIATSLSVLNDILYHAELIRSINLVAFGCVMFFLWLAISISMQALSNLNRAEIAEAEARSLAMNLEERVVQQTAHIHDIMINLQTDKEKIEDLNRFISEQVLRRYLPPEFLEDLQNNRHLIDAKPQVMAITVLFADLCEFTKATERLGAERVTLMLNQFFNAMTRLAFQTGGTIDKFTGDGIMVLFGAPRSAPAAELNAKALHCALDMQQAMQELNRDWQKEFGQTLALRIGLHHGPAVVGSFGNDQRVDYTAIGGTVNLASRLEGIAQPGQITCTEAVLMDLPGWEADSLGHRQLKGFEEPIQVFAMRRRVDITAA